jgi:tetratricopeptide (TPR) repeat protein
LTYPTILGVLSVFLIGPPLGHQTMPAQDRASNGISFARQGNLLDAERELRAAVNEAPSVALYRAQLGSVLGLLGNWNDALESFQKAVQLAPENLDFRREAAAVQWQLGLMPAAESNLHYVLEKRPGDPGALLLLGLVKEKTGDYAKAAQLLDSQFELVATQPERTVAFFHALMETGQADKIAKIVDVLKLHENDHSWAGAASRCTQLAITMGELQAAETLFTLIPADDSLRAGTGFQLAKVLYNGGRVSRAKDLLLQLKSQGIENADVETLLGNCLESERQPEQAIAAYHRAIEGDPSHIDRYEDLISLLLYLRRTVDALLLVKQALAIAPNDSRAWVWKGNVDLYRNAYEDAMESYTHALQLDNANPDALFGVSGALYVSGQTEAAISECKAGISRFPDDMRFYVSYAEMLLASPDALRLHAEAKDLLEKALKIAPQSAQAHYLLGQIALQEGKLKEAEEDLVRSLASDPDRSKTHFALSRVYRRTERTDQAAREFAIYERLKEREESGNTTPHLALENQ